MGIALTLASMTILNWITIETAAKVYLAFVLVGYIQLVMELFHERPTSSDR